MSGFLGAIQFLTRVPIHHRVAPRIARCVPWFPVVGALIGLLIGLIAAGLWDLVPHLVGASIAVLTGVALTGAFHEDGLADMADALGGNTPEKRREILHDSRHGSYGVAAMTGTILLRVACVAALPPAAAVAGLVSAHTLARSGSLVVMMTAAQPTAPGLGSDDISEVRRWTTLLGVAIGVAIAAVAVGWWTIPLAGAVAVGATGVSLVARRAFGGVTGDVLGAVEQVGECLVLVVVSGLAAHYTIWWA